MPLYLSEPNMLPTAYDGAVSVDFQLLTRTYLGRGLDAIGAAQTCDGGMVTRGYLAQRIAFLTVTEREDVPDECLVREGVEAWARLALRMALYVRAYSALAAGEKLRAF